MATGEDIYRKPSTAMWDFMEKNNGGKKIGNYFFSLKCNNLFI